jgi:hypothetical protein
MLKHLIFLIFLSGKIQEEIIPEYALNEIDIVYYKPEKNIFHADSVKALAMLINRECPECTFDEKVHVASCVVTGSKSLGVTWKVYLFEKKQFWGFKHPKIEYRDTPEHKQNLMASIEAWKNPYRVRFYASNQDTKTHFNKVQRKGYKKKGFYHHFTY